MACNGFIWLKMVVGSSEHGIEFSGSLKFREFLGKLRIVKLSRIVLHLVSDVSMPAKAHRQIAVKARFSMREEAFKLLSCCRNISFQ